MMDDFQLFVPYFLSKKKKRKKKTRKKRKEKNQENCLRLTHMILSYSQLKKHRCLAIVLFSF